MPGQTTSGLEETFAVICDLQRTSGSWALIPAFVVRALLLTLHA
jgi:hypothetical protein